jgi:hypothetical protein
LDLNGVAEPEKPDVFPSVFTAQKTLLRGTIVAVYIAGQERRLVDPPSQVVAGVRTVTTKMDGRCDPHVAAPILFMTKRKVACAFLFLRALPQTEGAQANPQLNADTTDLNFNTCIDLYISAAIFRVLCGARPFDSPRRFA